MIPENSHLLSTCFFWLNSLTHFKDDLVLKLTSRKWFLYRKRRCNSAEKLYYLVRDQNLDDTLQFSIVFSILSNSYLDILCAFCCVATDYSVQPLVNTIILFSGMKIVISKELKICWFLHFCRIYPLCRIVYLGIMCNLLLHCNNIFC